MLDRAVTVVEAVVRAGQPVGPRALARDTGIDRSAVGRILRQLSDLGVLAKENGTYHPEGHLFTIGRVLSAQDTLQAAASAALSGLVAVYDETSYVCTLHGQSVVFLYECREPKPLRYVVEIGKPVPLHAGAAGRAILLGLSEDDARQLLAAGPLMALTDATITSVDTLLDIRQARTSQATGYSVSRGARQERRGRGGAVLRRVRDLQGIHRVRLSAEPIRRHRRRDIVSTGCRAPPPPCPSRLGAVA